MPLKSNRIHQGDCTQLLAKLEPGTVHLAFADPPFNIGYEYDVYDDRKAYDHYLDWSRTWMAGVHRVLRPDGTFWLAIGDEYAAELKLIAQRSRLHVAAVGSSGITRSASTAHESSTARTPICFIS